MKNLRFTILFMLMATMFYQCKKDDLIEKTSDDPNSDLKSASSQNCKPGGTFTVKIENISKAYDYFAAGGQFIPDGESSAGPAFPGHSFTVKFHAGKGHKLSFATMYGASNDLFYAPSGAGINLFDSGGNPTTGNITALISLWDAGTEVNHAPASGEDGAEESVTIKSVRNTDNVMDGFIYNNVEDNVEVTLAYDGVSKFTLTIKNLSGSSTPLSPVAWVVHYGMQNPIFTEGKRDYGKGLEYLAETGNATVLSKYLTMHSGYVSPIAPGVWVLHKKGQKPIFTKGQPNYGEGLEMLSEVGDPTTVYNSLLAKGYKTGVYNTPNGANSPAPLFPGDSYTFAINANPGDYFSFASMLGKSNDLFFAPGDQGIRLFEGRNPVKDNLTCQVMLWDAGTEMNEYPGAGIHQGPGGADVSENVMIVNDEFMWPKASQVIKVTIKANKHRGHYGHGNHHKYSKGD
jgi:hypothetical protein